MADDKSIEQLFGLNNILLDEDISDKLFYYGSIKDFRSFIRTADKSIGIIQSAESARLVVLEAWLLLDYSVRSLLLSILDLNTFNHPDYDLGEFLLPQSLSDCIDLIYRIKEVNMRLPDNPDFNSIKMRGKFLLYLQDKEPEFFNQFIRIEDEYYTLYLSRIIQGFQRSLICK